MRERGIKGLLFLVLCTILMNVVGCSGSGKKEQDALMVFAASSLTDVLNELVDSFEVNYDERILINTASSGTLARQIVQGAEPDVFISASIHWANYIDSLGFFQQGFKAEVAHNTLVLVAPHASGFTKFELAHLSDSLVFKTDERISMGDPAHVPAGAYAKQALQFFDVYKYIEPRILPAKDVRSALLVVELGECPFGIVYQTDAIKSGKVDLITTIPEKSHDPILYTAGLCQLNASSKLFFSYLQSEQAKSIWSKYGFQ